MRCFQALTVVLGMFCMAASVCADVVSVGTNIVLNGSGEIYTQAENDWPRPTSWIQGLGSLGTFEDASTQAGSRRLTVWSGGADTQAYGYQVFYNADGFSSNVGSLSLNAYMRHEGTDGERWSQVVVTAGYSADGATLTDLQNTLTVTSYQDPSGWENVTGSIPILHGTTPTNYVKISLITLTTGAPTGFASNFDSVSLTAQPIPEPSTVALAAAGMFGLICYAWRKRK